jgi:hypothetical protein
MQRVHSLNYLRDLDISKSPCVVIDRSARLFFPGRVNLLRTQMSIQTRTNTTIAAASIPKQYAATRPRPVAGSRKL